jgi:hypothetical protein
MYENTSVFCFGSNINVPALLNLFSTLFLLLTFLFPVECILFASGLHDTLLCFQKKNLFHMNSPCKSEIPSLEEQMAAPAGSLAVSDSTGAADCSS